MATLFSDELNYLIYRYLQENGFVHTAYTLSCEAGIASSNIDGSKAPNGSLVTIVQVQEFLAEKGDSGESVENVKLSLLDSVTPNNPNIDASYVRKGNNDKFHSNNINGAFAEDGIKSMSLMNGSLKEYQNMNLIHLASTSRNAEYDYMDTSGPGPIKTREKTPNIRNNLDRQKRDNDINKIQGVGTRDGISPQLSKNFSISNITSNDSSSHPLHDPSNKDHHQIKQEVASNTKMVQQNNLNGGNNFNLFTPNTTNFTPYPSIPHQVSGSMMTNGCANIA